MFNTGDKVKIKKILKGGQSGKKQFLGQEFTITNAGFHGGSLFPHHLSMSSEYDWADEELKKVKPKKLKLPYFLLQYEIDGDPIEEIQTLREVKKRIEELHKVKGHSFVVYEVTNKKVITIEQRVEIKGI